jgi:hypothetical protein
MSNSPQKTDLPALKQLLKELKKEAKRMGLPLARIRDIDDLNITLDLVEKKRG